MKMILLTAVSLVHAQQLIVSTNGTLQKIPVEKTEISVSSFNGTMHTVDSPADEIRLIVEVRQPSSGERGLFAKQADMRVYASAKAKVQEALPGTVIDKEYRNAFVGFSFVTQRSTIGAIASLPDVQSVSLDFAVQSLPVEILSGDATAPKAANEGTTGMNIRIGVIDTGIDYNHEAFGKGFGPDFTVAGGYDFVNKDNDPMDDNGHGTHVAGIISGNSSTITGLARDAKLFAYKALDRSGNGSASTVIAAIDRAIEDSIDILNISLGSSDGSSDDPLSKAVNRAVQLGMVVVVAAGNSSGFSSITSPGVAEFALTVGAVDQRTIASFSSKGPELRLYGIKPDVVAPGVNILSSIPGGGYAKKSGTSMATPFVTAYAAALKELHPGWTAMQIRDALISGSDDVGTSFFAQGHGVLNEDVLSVSVFTSPATITFGYNPPSEQIWKQSKMVTLVNSTNTRRRYTFASAGNHPGFSVRCQLPEIIVEPNASTEVQIELEAKNTQLSNNVSIEAGYFGTVRFLSSVDTLIVPFAFMKAPVLQLRFDEIPWLVLVHDRRTFSKTYSPKSQHISMIVNEGVYDIVTSFYGSRYVFSEGLTVKEKAEAVVQASAARNKISFPAVDGNGQAIDLSRVTGTYSYLQAIVHQPSGFAITEMGGGMANAYCNRTKYFSTVSASYVYGQSFTLQPDNQLSYSYMIVVDSGITKDVNFLFTGDDMKDLDIRFELPAQQERVFPVTWTTFAGKSSSLGVAFYDGKAKPLPFPYIQKAWYSKNKKPFPIFNHREAYRY